MHVFWRLIQKKDVTKKKRCSNRNNSQDIVEIRLLLYDFGPKQKRYKQQANISFTVNL